MVGVLPRLAITALWTSTIAGSISDLIRTGAPPYPNSSMSSWVFPAIQGSPFPLPIQDVHGFLQGLIPSNSLHLFSCAQITIVNHERAVDAPSCYVLFSFFLILFCSSAMRIRSPCSSYAVYTQGCGKGRASVRVPEPPADWEAWVEVAVKLFVLVQQLLLSLDHHPVGPTKFSSNGGSQSSNGSLLTGFALDISTSATLSSTSLTHTFRTIQTHFVVPGLCTSSVYSPLSQTCSSLVSYLCTASVSYLVSQKCLDCGSFSVYRYQS